MLDREHPIDLCRDFIDPNRAYCGDLPVSISSALRKDGVWIYEPKGHTLLPHLHDDIRAKTGTQEFVKTAPLNLVYVAHGERMGDVSAEDKRLYASVGAGFIGQNVYLFCASEGLATVFRASLDYRELAKVLGLGPGQFVAFAQTVGYPA